MAKATEQEAGPTAIWIDDPRRSPERLGAPIDAMIQLLAVEALPSGRPTESGS